MQCIGYEHPSWRQRKPEAVVLSAAQVDNPIWSHEEMRAVVRVHRELYDIIPYHSQSELSVADAGLGLFLPTKRGLQLLLRRQSHIDSSKAIHPKTMM